MRPSLIYRLPNHPWQCRLTQPSPQTSSAASPVWLARPVVLSPKLRWLHWHWWRQTPALDQATLATCVVVSVCVSSFLVEMPCPSASQKA